MSAMRRWLVVGLGASAAACSLIIDTSGLSGAPGDDGGPAGADAADAAAVSDATSDVCIGSGCVAPPLPPCDGPCVPFRIAVESPVRGIAADESGVYWTAPGPGDIRRAAVDGTSIVTVYKGSNSPTLLVTDDRYVFWTEAGKGNVRAAEKNGDHGALTAEITGEAFATAIATSAGKVFWHAKTTGDVKSATTALGSVQIIGNVNQTVEQLAADSKNLYVAVGGAGNIVRRIDLMGGGTTDVSPKVAELRSVVSDGARVYYTSGNVVPVVQSVTVAGADLRSYGSDEKEPRCVAVDATHVYWATYTDGTIRRALKGGGAAETVASGQTQPFAIAVNSRAIYWLNEIGDVMMLRKP